MLKVTTSQKEEESNKLIKELEDAGIELKIEFEELKKENKEKDRKLQETVELFKRLEKQKDKEVFVEIKPFRNTDPNFLEAIWRISNDESFRFMMHSLQKETVSKLIEAQPQEAMLIQHILKGITVVASRIEGLSAAYEAMQEADNG